MDIERLAERAIVGVGVDREEALALATDATDIWELMWQANRIRREHFGNRVSFCSIINAKSGMCANDCAFCSQSAHHNTGVEVTPVVEAKEARRASREAASHGAANFGLVTSGASLDDDDLSAILGCSRAVKGEGMIGVCASLGELTTDMARRLYDSGVRRYHHNLETSRGYYPKVCSTYDYDRKIRTLRTARDSGMSICCGGIFGLGESWEDRVDMAMTIREIDADSIPLNFLRPIPGTPLGKRPLLEPLEALRIVAVYRFIFPAKTIKVCGGREHVLRDMQSWMFFAGANGAMLGNYLTTSGRAVEEDLGMVKDLGLEVESCGRMTDDRA